MFLRYAYSPSFEAGWAIGVQLVIQTVAGTDEHKVIEGFAYTKTLKGDAYVRASDLDSVLSTSLTPADIESADIAEFSRVAAAVSLTPSVYPWDSMDGALSSLAVIAGDSAMTAEWNTEYPDGWSGLEELHSLLQRFFTKYR